MARLKDLTAKRPEAWQSIGMRLLQEVAVPALPGSEGLDREGLELMCHRSCCRRGHLQVLPLVRRHLPMADLGHSKHDGELVVDPVLEHEPHLVDQHLAAQGGMAVDRPDQESLQPDQKRVRQTLLPGWEVREYQADGQQDAYGSQEELKVLGQTCPQPATHGEESVHRVHLDRLVSRRQLHSEG